jgi:hypothetical protein
MDEADKLLSGDFTSLVRAARWAGHEVVGR